VFPALGVTDAAVTAGGQIVGRAVTGRLYFTETGEFWRMSVDSIHLAE